MRRVLLFAALLLLVSLTTAFAASFDVQAEDITSFSTPVSISVPEPTPLPSVLYIRGPASSPPGSIDLEAPVTNDSVTSFLVLNDSVGVQTQSDSAKYFSWESPSAPANGYLLQGTPTLYIEQDGLGGDRLTGALFDCASTASIASTDPSLCTVIAEAVAEIGSSGAGFKERVVHFPTIPATTITSGRELRLKIINQQPSSTADWKLQWGYLPSRQSRLEFASP